MKNLITFSLFMTLFFKPGMVSSQSLELEFGTGLRTMIIDKALNDTYDTPVRLGFSMGLSSTIDLADHISLQPGLRFITKGGQLIGEDQFDKSGYKTPDTRLTESVNKDYDPGTALTIKGDYTNKLSVNYLEIPVLLQARISSDTRGIFFQGGPYLGIGLFGKNSDSFESEALINPDVTEKKIEFGSSSRDDHPRFEGGIVLGAGYFAKGGDYENKNLYIGLQTGIGLSDLPIKNRVDSGSGTYNNFYIQLTIGFSIASFEVH